MAWLIFDAMTYALAAVRAIHFAASALLLGSLVFQGFAVAPAASSPVDEAGFDRSIVRLAGTALAVALITGLVWLVLVAASMSGRSLGEASGIDVISTTLQETQFGLVTEIRFVIAVVLGLCLIATRGKPLRWFTLLLAAAFVGAIAWTGHAGSSFGDLALVHLIADVFHLIAASAWLGGLVPLAMLLSAASRHRGSAWHVIAHGVTVRFASVGLASVGVLVLSGLINAWFLVGSLRALVITQYGRLLLIKLALFGAMLMLAAINRFRLTPRLAPSAHADGIALRRLKTSCITETAIGLLVLVVIGLLGTLHPAIHLVADLE